MTDKTKKERQPLPPGPEQPTFIERFAALIPLPYPLAGAIWTVVLGPPAIVLLNLVYIGDLGQSLELFFPMVPPAAVWQRALAERKVEKLAAWPFDTKILGKLSAIVLSIIAGLIINVLVKMVLKI
jgi:hypothetical protein